LQQAQEAQKPKTKTEAGSSTSNVEDQIKKLEQDWAQAIIAEDPEGHQWYFAHEIKRSASTKA
jgi:hypothetical protein